jgi:hypothetical protein
MRVGFNSFRRLGRHCSPNLRKNFRTLIGFPKKGG